jgi:hypothetical protein
MGLSHGTNDFQSVIFPINIQIAEQQIKFLRFYLVDGFRYCSRNRDCKPVTPQDCG